MRQQVGGRARQALVGLMGLVFSLASCDRPAPSATAGRTVAAVHAALEPGLTAAEAARRLGSPDSVAGSGLFIALYRADSGRTVWLGFAGAGPLVYAKVRGADGRTTDLPVR